MERPKGCRKSDSSIKTLSGKAVDTCQTHDSPIFLKKVGLALVRTSLNFGVRRRHLGHWCWGIADILFQGADFDDSILPNLLGAAATTSRANVVIWDVEWVAVNDANTGEGVFYIKGAPKQYPYTLADLDKYAEHCYDTGKEYLPDKGFRETTNEFEQAEDEAIAAMLQSETDDEPDAQDWLSDKEIADAYFDMTSLLPLAQSPIGFVNRSSPAPG